MIEFSNVTKYYGQQSILSGISFSIPKGQTVVLIGLSGCGKTTTLKMLNRLITPTSGKIYIHNKEISQWNVIRLRRKMGYVIQQTGLFPHLTVKENIEIILRLEKCDSVFINERTAELMELVGLDKNLLDRFPTQLSGGQQQRVGVARAFATDPEIILMDEPFSALDPMTRSDLQDGLTDLQEKLQKNIIFVTHDMSEALKIADRICIMDQGQIIQYDTPENILRNPCNDFVAEFVGKNRLWNSPEFIKVKDIMIDQPIACSSKTTLVNCIEKMRRYGVGSLMIIEEKNKKFLGVLSAKKVQMQTDMMQKAGTVMKTQVLTANPEDSILDTLKKINEKNTVKIPVVTNEKILVGLLTRSSLLTAMSQQYFDADEDII